MCFITILGPPERRIADRDIPCWKYLIRVSDDVYRSPVLHDKIWHLAAGDFVATAERWPDLAGREPKTPLTELEVVRNDDTGWVINEGFHTYSADPSEWLSGSFHVVEFYIPEGTEYVHDHGEYASVRLGYRVKWHVFPEPKSWAKHFGEEPERGVGTLLRELLAEASQERIRYWRQRLELDPKAYLEFRDFIPHETYRITSDMVTMESYVG